MPPVAAEYFGGREAFDLPAATIFDLLRALDAITPGFAGKAELRIAFAVDGTLITDWSSPLPEQAEVLLVPRVAGG